YLGQEPIESAVSAIGEARAAGMRMCFTTNNASKTPEHVAGRLRDMAVPATADDVVTSAQAAARLLADDLPPASAVLVVGTAALADAVSAVGLTPVRVAGDQPRAVVQGYDPQLTYARLAEAALAIRAGARWVATNVDATLPDPRGLLPGNGALVAAVATATGASPAVAGKPERPLHAEAVRRSGARRPLVVGDRLDTDIVGAVKGEADSLLVLTG